MNKFMLSALACATLLAGPAGAQTPPDASLIARGHALAIASDCMACHTDTPHQGKPYAGGYGIASPMGTIYATNITPSVRYGIGRYTETQFARALREGIRGDGAHLYPAMPYTAYTRLSDEDIHALYSYFMHGVAPVDTPPEAKTDLPFPFNIRLVMAAWNLLYLDNARFVPDSQATAEINEGAWLVQGPAHCGTCHTPRNLMMAEDQKRYLAGAQLGPWYAPNISPDATDGIGSWSEQQIVDYLRTGRAEGKAQAAGPMAEAIEHSLQYLTAQQLHAIAAYLKTVPAQPGDEDVATATPADNGNTSGAWNVENSLRGKNPPTASHTLTSGEALYSGYCASCHQPDGSGSENQAYPALTRNTVTAMGNPSNLIAAILFGVDRTTGGHQVLMPAFGEGSYVGELTDKQIADIANFVLQKYGNARVTVTPQDVAQIRAGGPKPFIAQVQPFIIPGMGVGGIIVLALIIWLLRRRLRKQASK